MDLFSAALLLFLVMDPFGNIPAFLVVLDPIPAERRRRVLVRELLIALAFLVAFLFTGRYLLEVMGISESALTISGGIILFLIALRMIFPPPGGVYTTDVDQAESEPLLVPLAVPLIAGPSSLASVMFLMSDDPARWPTWLAAVLLAWVVSGVVLYYSAGLARLIKHRGLIAIERLMGMVLIALAVQMLLSGIGGFFGVD